MEELIKHTNIFIEGKLEMADFNFYSQMGAYKFNINAIYKNGDTRHVDIEAEGKAQDIEKYINYIKNGALRPHIELFKTEDGKLMNIEGFSSLKVHKEKFKIIKKLLSRKKSF